MKIKAFFLSVTLVVFFATSLHSQEKKIYKHPAQDFSFSASGEWQQKINEKRILTAMSYSKPYGKDAPERCQGKSYNAMHIAQIWCPADSYDRNKEYIDGIVASLELKK